MPIKKVLALPSDPATAESVLTCALYVSADFGGHIEVTHIRDDAVRNLGPIFDGLPSRVLDDMEGAQARLIREREEAVRARFDAFVDRTGIAISETPVGPDAPSACWRTAPGSAPEFIATRGGAYDLIVAGRPLTSSPITYATIESALFSTGRPVLLAPPEPPAHIGERVMVAWNRSPQAARAFHAAKELILRQAKRIRILSIVTGAKQGPSAAEIADNLAWHGIEAEVREMTPDSRAIGEVVLAEASATHADLLIMGAFSNSRLRQIMFGGVTKHILENATLPVLMAN